MITLFLATSLYAAPDVGAWYESLKQPDYPGISCCGWADAYYADKTEECGVSDGTDCALVAIITDTRADTRTLTDGRVLTRPHLDVGLRIPIPKNKIRKIASENPIDHNVVFVSGEGYVFCWEPAAGI